MKMADGGYRPAVTAQLASDCDSQVIVGVELSTAGTDMAQLAPMVDQVGRRRCVVLLFALAHNLMRTLALAPQLLGLGPTPSAATAGTV